MEFGALAATNVVVVSATAAHGHQPRGTAGTVNVTVTTVGGTSGNSTADQFTYQAPPAVTGVSPASGPLAGGTSVTITGTSLTAATAVDFGSDGGNQRGGQRGGTQITATSPAEPGHGGRDGDRAWRRLGHLVGRPVQLRAAADGDGGRHPRQGLWRAARR